MTKILGIVTLSLVGLLGGCATASKTASAPAAATDELRLGNHRRKVSTTNAEAQRAFDRGLTLAFSFAHRASEAEFRRAAELDPRLAMAWWGVALVNGPHINFPMVPEDRARIAWDALRKAQELAAGTTQVEQDLIAALAKRYRAPQPQDRSGLDKDYADAMREVWKKYPKDQDVGTLFAESMMDLRPWNLWLPDGTPQPGTLEIVATLEKVLAMNPNHPGAIHYYIHTVEASPMPERAEKPADRLGKLVPDSGHMVHMPAHIYARVGRWTDAANSNIAAMVADKKYRAKFPRPGFYAIYMLHNAHFLGWNLMIEGRSEEAIRVAREMVAGVPEDFKRDFAPVVDGYMAFPVEVLMRFGKWEEILKEPAPEGNLPLSTALWRYTRAAALAALDRLPEAREAQAVFEEAARKVPDDYTFGNNSATNLLAIARLALAGEIAAKEKNFDAAIKQLTAAVAIEDTLRYDEPPDWMQPVRHTLGAILLRAEKPAEAEAVYRADLKKYPKNGWALYGLGEALDAQKKNSREVKGQFKKAWARADFKLSATCLCMQ